MVRADQVQARVDTGGGAGAGEHRTVLDIEDVEVDLGERVPTRKRVGIPPMGGAATPVKEAGRPEHERTGAHRHDPRTSLDRVAQNGEEGLGEGAIRRAGGYGDKIGVRGTLEPVGGDDCEAARCRHRSTRVEGTDPEVERRHTVVGAVDAEDLSEDPELEGRGARCEQGSDDLNHRTRMAENKRTTPDLPLVA